MENMTENVADAEEDFNLDQDIFVESSGSEDNYLGELENIKNQGIEGRLELSSAWSARLKTTLYLVIVAGIIKLTCSLLLFHGVRSVRLSWSEDK